MSIDPPPTRSRALFDPDVSHQLGAKGTVVVVDVLQKYAVAAFDKTCGDTGCVLYRKRCDPAAKKCDYSVGYPGDADTVTPDYIFIEYENDRALEAIQKAIYLIVGPKENQSSISLMTLKASLGPEPEPVKPQ